MRIPDSDPDSGFRSRSQDPDVDLGSKWGFRIQIGIPDPEADSGSRLGSRIQERIPDPGL